VSPGAEAKQNPGLDSRWGPACCYLVGLATLGLGCLAIAVYASRRGMTNTILHARQSLVLNWGAAVLINLILYGAVLESFWVFAARTSRGAVAMPWLFGAAMAVGAIWVATNLLGFFAVALRHSFTIPVLGKGLGAGHGEDCVVPLQLDRDLSAASYIGGSLSGGLVSLLILTYARREQMERLSSDARRAAIRNALVFLAGLVLLVVGFLTDFGLSICGLVHPRYSMWILPCVCLGAVLLLLLNLLLCWWTASHILRGKKERK